MLLHIHACPLIPRPFVYAQLRESTTVIIHNAWRVDFNLALSSFESNIRGTRNLIDFALSASHASSLRFLFTSSISSAQSWDRTKGPYPEEVQLDAQYAVGAGYGEGKYVVERVSYSCNACARLLTCFASCTAPRAEWLAGLVPPDWPNLRGLPERGLGDH